MAEVLRQNVQDVYKKWESRSQPRLKSNSTYSTQYNCVESRKPRPNLVRSASDNFSYFDRRKKYKYPTAKLPKYHGIFQFKMAPSVLPIHKQRPYVGLCCLKCLPQSRSALSDNWVQSLSVCNLFHVPFLGKSAMYLPSSLQLLFFMFSRSARFNYPDVSDKVLQCERLSSAIKNAMEGSDLGIASSIDSGGQPDEGIEGLISRQKAEAQRMICDMKFSINQFFLRISSFFFYKTLSLMIQSIQVHKGHLETLKSSCEEDYPIIYVPLHRSHLDCVLISLILYMNNLKVPILTVGDSAIIPFFRKLMQYMGAFFVNRNQSMSCGANNTLYRTVLQSYLIEYLKACHSLEIFIEGGRSHTGRPCTPQTGLLSLVVDSLLEGDVEDAYIVPVAISYEKLIEDNYIFHQLGKGKSSDSFLSSVFSLWKMLHSNFGSVRVDFCQPFSLKEFLRSNNHSSSHAKEKVMSLETPPSSPGSVCSTSGSLCNDIPTPGRLKTVVKNLADHIIFDATCSTTLMCTQLIAFLLLSKHRQGATQPQLLCSFNWLRTELGKRKRDVGFTGNSSAVIKHAIALLGNDLIETEAIELEWTSSDMENNNVKVLFHKPVIKLPYVIELQYYANVAVPVFFLDSVVVNSLYAAVDDEICHFQLCDSKLFIWRDELIEKAVELCNILHFEYLSIPPCADLVAAVNEVIDELITKECLVLTGVGTYSSGVGQKFLARRCHHLSFDVSDDDEGEHSSIDQHLKVDLSEESIDYLKFLRNILSPCIESYWLTACTLLKLVHEVMEEKEFLREIQRTAEDRLHKGLLGYEESFGTETLKNSLKAFEYLEVIEHYYEDGLKFFYLCESYDSEEKVSDVISRVEVFRQ